jgi:hypothetical protein
MGLPVSSGISDQLRPIPFWSHGHGDELQRSIRTCIVILGFVLGKPGEGMNYPPKSPFLLCHYRPDKPDLRFGIIRHRKVLANGTTRTAKSNVHIKFELNRNKILRNCHIKNGAAYLGY